MRRSLSWLVILAVSGLLVLWASREEPVATQGPEGSHASDVRALPVFEARVQAAPSSASETRLHIRGSVWSPRGPVAGARVLASALVAGESLSALPCEKDASGGSLLECPVEREQLLSLVALRQGEAPVSSRATTAADGSFSLEGLEPGRYSLWVEGAEGTGLTHDVAAGDEGVELRLGAGVRLSGLVVDEAEAPVAGVLVTAIFKAHSRFFEAISDATGHYHLGPLPTGEYALVFSRVGFLSSVETFTGYEPEQELTSTLDRPRRIAGRVLRAGAPVAGAEVVSRDCWNRLVRRTLTDVAGRFSFEDVVPLCGQVIATHDGYGAFRDVFGDDASEFERARGYTELTLELAPVSHVEGVVRDETRRSIAGVSIQVEQRNGGEYLQGRALTDAQGRYRLGPVRPGPVKLEVTKADGFVPASLQSQAVAGENTVDLTFARAVLVEGRVVDAAGQPLAGEPLDLRTLAGEQALATNYGRKTGPDGRFSLDAPGPGRYRLEVGGERMARQALEVDAPSNERISAERWPSVEGEVVDPAGVPLPQILVSLWPVTGDKLEDELARGYTDLQGRFSFSAPAEGRFRITAGLRHGDYSRSTTQPLEVGKAGARVRLRIEEGRRLSGVVVDRRGQPVEGARVRVVPPLHGLEMGCGGPPIGATTDAEGRFTFRGISGEQLEVHAWKDGYLDVSRDGSYEGFPLEPGARDVRLVLLKDAHVTGRFVRVNGSPITVFELNGEERMDDKGRFSLPIFRGGTMRLELTESGSQAEPLRRTVTVQEEVDLDVGTVTLGP